MGAAPNARSDHRHNLLSCGAMVTAASAGADAFNGESAASTANPEAPSLLSCDPLTAGQLTTKRTKDQKKTVSGKPEGTARNPTSQTASGHTDEFSLRNDAPIDTGLPHPGRQGAIVQAPNTTLPTAMSKAAIDGAIRDGLAPRKHRTRQQATLPRAAPQARGVMAAAERTGAQQPQSSTNLSSDSD
jgi:hypothetical protein